MPFPDGSSITQWHELDRTCDELARFSGPDADAYRRMLAEYDAVKHLFGRDRYTPAGWGPGLSELLRGHPQGNRRLRRQAQSAWDIIAAAFEDWHVRAFLLWMAFLTMQPPDRPGTGPLAFSLAYGRQQHSWVMPETGSGALPQALSRLISAHGGEVRTRAPVVRLLVQDRRCVGVETADGSRYWAQRAVLSTIHIKDLVGMAPAAAWGDDFVAGVESWRPGVSMFVAHYATSEPPRYPTQGGTQTAVAAGIATSVDRVLRIGSDFLRGRVAMDDPVLLVVCPTLADPSRAPAGHHTLKVIGFQPYELVEGPERWDAIKEEVAARNLTELRRYAPNLTERTILASAVESPLDLERFNAHNWHGSCHGGDMSPAQSGRLRPVPGWAEHRLPITGLYQTGATTHPGGSVSGGPGRNAAMVILRDLGTSLEAVVAAPTRVG